MCCRVPDEINRWPRSKNAHLHCNVSSLLLPTFDSLKINWLKYLLKMSTVIHSNEQGKLTENFKKTGCSVFFLFIHFLLKIKIHILRFQLQKRQHHVPRKILKRSNWIKCQLLELASPTPFSNELLQTFDWSRLKFGEVIEVKYVKRLSNYSVGQCHFNYFHTRQKKPRESITSHLVQ